MGSFSWLRADGSIKQNNFVPGDIIKFLIPKEFGGGFVKGTYEDYGKINTGEYTFDVYDVLAAWNKDAICDDGETVLSHLEWKGEFPVTPKDINERLGVKVKLDKNGQPDYFNNVRKYGIEIGCYISEVAMLKYPLKMVSPTYNCTYETCKHRSYSDPNQGFYKTEWNEHQIIQDVPVYPISGTKEDIENYWKIIAQNEIAVIRSNYLKEHEDIEDFVKLAHVTLTNFKNAYENLIHLYNKETIDSKEYLNDDYPFNKPLNELNISAWIDKCNKNLDKILKEN